jgi:hypothetical protein
MQIGHGKQGIFVGEYCGPSDESQDGNAILGYIEPACSNPAWILYFTRRGEAIFHRERSDTGATLDEAIVVKGLKVNSGPVDDASLAEPRLKS